MATLTPTLSLAGTAADFGDLLSFSVSKALTLGDNDAKISRTYAVNDANPGGPQIYDTGLGKCYIYLKNLTASTELHITSGATTAKGSAWLHLAGGEFAFFPWAGKVDLFANSGDNGVGIVSDALEVLIYQA